MDPLHGLFALVLALTPPFLILRWFWRAWRWEHFFGDYVYGRRFTPNGVPWAPPPGADPERLSDALFPGHEHFVVEHDLSDHPARTKWEVLNIPMRGWHGVVPKRDIDPILKGYLIVKPPMDGVSNRVHLLEPGTWFYSSLRYPGHRVVHEWHRFRVRPARPDEVEALRR